MIVGDHEDVGIRDVRLRAQDALRLGPPQLVAGLTLVEQQEATNELGPGCRVQLAHDARHHWHALEARDRRGLRVDDNVVDALAHAVGRRAPRGGQQRTYGHAS